MKNKGTTSANRQGGSHRIGIDKKQPRCGLSGPKWQITTVWWPNWAPPVGPTTRHTNTIIGPIQNMKTRVPTQKTVRAKVASTKHSPYMYVVLARRSKTTLCFRPGGATTLETKRSKGHHTENKSQEVATIPRGPKEAPRQQIPAIWWTQWVACTMPRRGPKGPQDRSKN